MKAEVTNVENFMYAVRNYSFAKERVVGRLVNPMRFDISDRPHRMWQDLALIYDIARIYSVDGEDRVVGSLSVTNSDLLRWGVNEETLFQQVHQNMETWNPVKIASIAESPVIGIMYEPKDIKGQMCAITDSLETYGATNVCYPEALRNLGEKFGEDFYIFPSTKVEMILMPESFVRNAEMDVSDMFSLQKDVSADMETLSDNIYIYRKDEATVEIAY